MGHPKTSVCCVGESTLSFFQKHCSSAKRLPTNRCFKTKAKPQIFTQRGILGKSDISVVVKSSRTVSEKFIICENENCTTITKEKWCKRYYSCAFWPYHTFGFGVTPLDFISHTLCMRVTTLCIRSEFRPTCHTIFALIVTVACGRLGTSRVL